MSFFLIIDAFSFNKQRDKFLQHLLSRAKLISVGLEYQCFLNKLEQNEKS